MASSEVQKQETTELMRCGSSERLHILQSQSQNLHHDMLGATESSRRLRKERGSGEHAAHHRLFTQLQQISLELGIWRRHDAKLKENKMMDKQEPNLNTSTLTFDPL